MFFLPESLYVFTLFPVIAETPQYSYILTLTWRLVFTKQIGFQPPYLNLETMPERKKTGVLSSVKF